MKLNKDASMSWNENFSVFRQFYNCQISKQQDCLSAFEVASILFFKQFGFYLFRSVDEYLHELFKVNNGYQFLDKSRPQ